MAIMVIPHNQFEAVCIFLHAALLYKEVKVSRMGLSYICYRRNKPIMCEVIVVNDEFETVWDQYEEETKTQKKSRYERLLAHTIKLRDNHKGLWLDEEAANVYAKKAMFLPGNDGQDIGERRELRIELQETYGLLEIEAINILNGYHIQDYVTKYYNIQNLIVPGFEEGKNNRQK